MVSYHSLFAQNGENRLPRIGKLCPDFELTDVHFFNKKTVALQDLKGKWFVLDFWNRYCSACLASFPKNNSLQQKYSDKLQFLLVGYNGSQYSGKSDDKSIRALYDRCKQRENLILPVAYDSALFDKFRIGPCPYIILADDRGIVRAITPFLNDTIIEKFLNGETPRVPYAMNGEEIKDRSALYDINVPYLVNNNGGNDSNFLYRSLLSYWDPQKPKSLLSSIDALVNKGKFEVLGADLSTLYRYAYTGFENISIDDSLYGKVWNQPIWEMIDSSRFMPDFTTGQNIYCYSLIVPPSKADSKLFRKIMQKDLQIYFGYKVRIENRKMPYWRLIVDNAKKSKLMTKSHEYYYEDNGNPQTGFRARDYPISYLLRNMQYDHPGEPPFIDSTGINGNIDISINALMSDFNGVERALQENGLYLLKSSKVMKVIVISDKDTSN